MDINNPTREILVKCFREIFIKTRNNGVIGRILDVASNIPETVILCGDSSNVITTCRNLAQLNNIDLRDKLHIKTVEEIVITDDSSIFSKDFYITTCALHSDFSLVEFILKNTRNLNIEISIEDKIQIVKYDHLHNAIIAL